MKKNNRQTEKIGFSTAETSLEFFDLELQRSKSAAHSNRLSQADKKTLKNLKNEKIKENES